MAEHNPFPGENNTGHFWDDNLRELANPPPRWWMIGLWVSILWFVLYGILYPMFPALTADGESSKGILGWTQMDEYKKGVAEVEAVRAEYENKIKGMDVNAILADSGVKQYAEASAKVLFGDYCAACHGSGGQGNPGFPVLADDDWLYGGDPNTLVASITNGRKGVMTAHVKAKVLTTAEAEKMARWVVGMKDEGKAMDHDPEAQQMFMTKGCIACHGPDAKGVDALGGADLTSVIWRFEPGGYESALYTISHGVNDISDPETREAEMPKFGERLSADDIKKVAVYVHGFIGH